MSVTAFLLHLVLSRLVGTQRDQIAVLKAFGYSNRVVGWHYLQLAFAAVFGGVVAGILLGAWLGSAMTEIYTIFFHFPISELRTKFFGHYHFFFDKFRSGGGLVLCRRLEKP